MIEKEDDEEYEDFNDQDKKPVDLKKQKSFSKISVNLGEEEYDIGKKQITQDIFQSKDKAKNAQQFIDNWQRTKHWHRENDAKQEPTQEEEEELKSPDDLKKVP